MTRLAQFALDVGVAARGRRLALERAHLATHFAHEIAKSFEVLLRGGEPALGPFLAATMLQHPGGLFDDRATIWVRRKSSRAVPDR